MVQMEQKTFSNKKCAKGNKKCSRTKFVPGRTKNVTKGTKNVHSENCFKLNRKSQFKVTKCLLYVFMAICGLGLVGPSMAWIGLLWSCMAF